MKKILAILLVASAGSAAQARVFNLAKESFASYLSFGYGPVSAAREAAFAEASSAPSSYTGQLNSVGGGEFGFISAGPILSWKFGFEVIKPPVVVSTARSASASLYEVKSDLTGFMPKFGLDVSFLTTASARYYLSTYIGQASLTVTNDYSSVNIAPNTAFTEKYKGNAQAWSAGLGVELAAFDTTSVNIEAGYRRMAFNEFSHGVAVTADFTGAARAVGDAVYLTSGERRKIDLSGFYATVGARFWLF